MSIETTAPTPYRVPLDQCEASRSSEGRGAVKFNRLRPSHGTRLSRCATTEE